MNERLGCDVIIRNFKEAIDFFSLKHAINSTALVMDQNDTGIYFQWEITL